MEDREVFRLRKQVLTLVRLDQLGPRVVREHAKRTFVVIVGAGSRRFGLVVDSLIGEEELVIKALEDRLCFAPRQRSFYIRRRNSSADLERYGGDFAPLEGSAARGHGMSQRIRVLVVDDSALMRKLIPQTLLRDPSIEVVGTAMDGLLALRKIEELHPDVVTLDLEMPRMDGMETLRQITRKHHIPVIVFSAHTEQGADVTLKALSLGAFDFVTKPQDAALGRIGQIASELALKIKAAAASGAPKLIITEQAPRQEQPHNSSIGRQRPSRIVAIGISTGGPNALQYLFSSYLMTFRAVCWWYSTCRRGLRICLRDGWMNPRQLK